MRLFSLVFVLSLLFTGCANKRAAANYYRSKNYAKAYEEYYEYAKRGFPDASEKIARLIYLDRVKKPPFTERKYALFALENGYDKANIYVADSYFREKEYQNALKWYEKVDFKDYKAKDFKNYLTALDRLNNIDKKIELLDKLYTFTLKSDLKKFQTELGKYYLKKSPLYNPTRAKKLLKNAIRQGYDKAKVILGVYLINNEDKKEGYTLLKEMVYKDAKAAYYVGNYLYDKMVENEKLYNKKCISSNSKTTKKLFDDKLYIYKYNDIFTRKNIQKAYKSSYRLGNKKAIYRLIDLDIEDNTYELSDKTYSGFDLNSTVSFLNSQQDVKSKLILAKIYEKYLYLNSRKSAKEIYKWYEHINKPQAYWHLYQYEKRFEKRVDYEYLNYLTNIKFTPAVIEKAYQEALVYKNIEKNRKTLEYFANQDNILALNYLGSLYANKIYPDKQKSFSYYKKACKLEKKPFYIPSEDLKIANYYNNILKDENKALGIYYYYAQMKNRQAQRYLVDFHKKNCDYKKMDRWLKELLDESDIDAKDIYYSLIVSRYVEGDFKKALNYLKEKDDIRSILTIADAYANGYGVDLNPQKAVFYYDKAISQGYHNAIYKKATLLRKINLKGEYDKQIIQLYKQAASLGLKDAKIKLAKFYLNKKDKQKALRTIYTIKGYNTNSKARYLLYIITGKAKYLGTNYTDYGYLLLAKAQNILNKAPQKALYYTFRAMLCNTPKTSKLAIKLMKKINSAKIIDRIYNKAKRAKKCYLY
ncbi:MAG: sel1 repeat family protein [Epsilonproteobacteria bacterium]|nr:sel1 repeat family protein [Campylobacterota bacterium]